MREWIAKFWNGLAGILAGIGAGAVLAPAVVVGPTAILADVTRASLAAYHYLATGQLSVESLGDLVDQAVWRMSLICSAVAALVATPLWIILGLFRRNGKLDALLLGIGLGGVLGLAFFNGQALLVLGIGLVGAVAGFVTWIVAHRTQKVRTLTS
jgi:hypothetical protein